MFGFGKRNKGVAKSKLIAFLDDADDALTLAYEQKDVRAAIPFLQNRLLDAVVEEIASGRDLTQELGLAKYRIRTWGSPIVNGADLIVRKQIRHKDVQIHGMIGIPVGDNIDEDWYVTQDTRGFVVTDIRRAEPNDT